MDKTEIENLENIRKEYLEERKLLIELEWRNAASFVKTMTALSASAFGLSLAFVEKLAPHPKLQTLVYIQGAWIAFAFSLGLLLVAHLTSQKSMRKRRDIDDKEWKLTVEGKLNPEEELPINSNWAWITNFLNVLSVVIFGVGAGLLIIFSSLNLPSA